MYRIPYLAEPRARLATTLLKVFDKGYTPMQVLRAWDNRQICYSDIDVETLNVAWRTWLANKDRQRTQEPAVRVLPVEQLGKGR